MPSLQYLWQMRLNQFSNRVEFFGRKSGVFTKENGIEPKFADKLVALYMYMS